MIFLRCALFVYLFQLTTATHVETHKRESLLSAIFGRSVNKFHLVRKNYALNHKVSISIVAFHDDGFGCENKRPRKAARERQEKERKAYSASRSTEWLSILSKCFIWRISIKLKNSTNIVENKGSYLYLKWAVFLGTVDRTFFQILLNVSRGESIFVGHHVF